MGSDERKIIVDYLRFMASSEPPPEVVACNPGLFKPDNLLIGKAMLRSCANQIEQGLHYQLLEELRAKKKEDGNGQG